MPDPKVKIIISYDEVGADLIEAVPDKMENVAARVSDTQQAMANLARGAMMAADQVNSFASGSIAALAGFDQAMANVVSIVQGSEEEIKQLRESAEQMGRDMPVSAQQVAEGYYILASAGKSANEIMKLTPGIMKLSIATGADFATTANLVTAALDSWEMSADETNRVNDILMNTVKSFKTTLPELAISLQYAASAAANLGVPLETTSAAIGLLRQRGLDASMAGTGFRMMLSKLAAAASATEGPLLIVKDALVQNADGTLNLTATMQNLQATLANVDPLERQSILTQVFGTRAAAAASILMEESASLDELSAKMGESGAVAEAYKVQSEGVANQLQVLQSRYEEQQRALAEQLLPAQIEITEAKIRFLE
ncbi:MAG: phage tail tape measure protein, partial [Thermoprotei archaeon]